MPSTISTQTDPQGVMTIWLDQPGRSVNTLTPQMLDELDEVIGELETNRDVKGVLIASVKPHSFIAGADLFAFRSLEPEELQAYAEKGQALLNRIAQLQVPTVAAINGNCLGGGLELALACRYRVASDDPSIDIGLPEVKLGIIPAWGGSVRLPRLIGLQKALPLMLAGKTMPPSRAASLGIVDELVRPEALHAAAKRQLRRPTARRAGAVTWATDHLPWSRNRIFDIARQKTERKTHGNYPAPLKLLDVVRTGYEKGPAAGLEAERTALMELLNTEQAHNLLRVFFLRHNAKRAASEMFDVPPIEMRHVAVIGGGTMGAGITHSLIKAGMNVRLIDMNPQLMQGALRRVDELLKADVSSRRMTRLQAQDAMHRICPSTDWTGLKVASVVIEAASEDMNIKQDIFRRLDQLTRPDAVLASNTSSLSVTQMAEAVEHRQRVIGLHFFNPVPMMPLVEVVQTPHSNDESLARGLQLATRIGKTPLLVNDAPGFVVNRLLMPYLAEALTMASQGVPIRHIDKAMEQWGMPMGPFELLDQIGLDIALAVLDSVKQSMGERIVVPDAVRQSVDQQWLGRKTGRGFYVYEQTPRGKWQPFGRGRQNGPQVHEAMVHTLAPAGSDGEAAKPPTEEEVQWRLVLPMINEAARVLEERVVDSVDAVDLATVLGLGLAPFRGGILHYADAVGAAALVRRLHQMAVEHGERYAPAALLQRSAQENQPLSAAAPSDSAAPGARRATWQVPGQVRS